MGIFDTTGIKKEEAKDSLGGSFVWDTGVYNCKITKAYIDQSKSGAYNVNITLMDLDTKKTLDITEYVTNREGANYYIDKKSGEKKLLPGMNKMNALAETLIDKELKDVEMEEKAVEVYDFDAGKRLPRPKKVLMDLLNVEGKFGILKVLDFGDADKTVEKIKEKNELDKVFTEAGLTLAEIKAGNIKPEFLNTYIDSRTADYIKDKTKGKGKVSTEPKKKKELPFG